MDKEFANHPAHGVIIYPIHGAITMYDLTLGTTRYGVGGTNHAHGVTTTNRAHGVIG
jgi:hypothetical protein